MSEKKQGVDENKEQSNNQMLQPAWLAEDKTDLTA